MNRREFVQAGCFLSLAGRLSLAADSERSAATDGNRPSESRLKITGLRMVTPKPRRPVPEYTPSPEAWSPYDVELSSPMSIYPKYKGPRALFLADDLGPPAVEITTDKGVTGIGFGGPGADYVIDRHFRKLLLGEDPFNIERLWDIMWRSTIYYGRKGMVLHAMSAIDNALWDLMGKALNSPVYRLLGGETKATIPAYCTGNDIEQHVEFGFTKLKLALPYGPADGRDGIRKHVELVERARKALGPDGEIMLDCWMAFDEQYTLELAAALEPYRVYWMEECLPPDDYEGLSRLNAQITTTRMATGEHEYTRYGFQLLKKFNAADIWQPDMRWCGGLTELRRICALAAADDIPVIPHAGAQAGAPHLILATPNCPWSEIFMPPPGGPSEVYERYEEEFNLTRGPDGISMRPHDRPGFGFDYVT